MVSLIMPFFSCDAGTDANITWPKELCHTLFQLSSSNEQNVAMDDEVSITWQQSLYQWLHMTEKVMFHLILIIVPNDCNGTIDSTIGITKMCLGIV